MEQVTRFVKEHPIWTVIIFIFIIPACVYGLSEIPLLPVCGNNDWAGFWGGYLGSIIGGIITFIVMWRTLRHEDDKQKRQEKIEYFNYIIKITAEVLQLIINYTCLVREDINMWAKTSDIMADVNAVAKVDLELNILIKSRLNEYDLDEINSCHSEIILKVQDVFPLYEECKDNNMMTGELILLLDEICDEVNEAKYILNDTVEKNLY